MPKGTYTLRKDAEFFGSNLGITSLLWIHFTCISLWLLTATAKGVDEKIPDDYLEINHDAISLKKRKTESDSYVDKGGSSLCLNHRQAIRTPGDS